MNNNLLIAASRQSTAVMLTIAQFGARYQVCRTRVYQLLNNGELNAVKSGRLTLIPLAEADAWAERLPKYEPGAVVAQTTKA